MGWGATKDELGRGSKIPAKTETRKTVYTVAGGKEEENQADKSTGPIARLNLIIQTHAISSSSSASRSAPLMFNHSRNVCFAKRN